MKYGVKYYSDDFDINGLIKQFVYGFEKAFKEPFKGHLVLILTDDKSIKLNGIEGIEGDDLSLKNGRKSGFKFILAVAGTIYSTPKPILDILGNDIDKVDMLFISVVENLKAPIEDRFEVHLISKGL